MKRFFFWGTRKASKDVYFYLNESEGSQNEKVKQEGIKSNKVPKTVDTKHALNYSNKHSKPPTKMHQNERNFITTKDACFACDVCTQTSPKKKGCCVIM